MGFDFGDVMKAVGIGAAILGGSSYLFPETTASLTGGMLGSSGVEGIGPVASGDEYAQMVGSSDAASGFSFTNDVLKKPAALTGLLTAGSTLVNSYLTAEEADKGRKFTESENEKTREQQTALQEDSQAFSAEEAAKRREFEKEQSKESKLFQFLLSRMQSDPIERALTARAQSTPRDKGVALAALIQRIQSAIV